MSRFVILRHETPADYPRPSHWDLMLESAGVLQTWALLNDPQQPTPQDAERLNDHRLAYLEREGPLSGNRGHVSCWDKGTYQTLVRTDAEWKVLLAGQTLQGQVILSCDIAHADQFRYQFKASS